MTIYKDDKLKQKCFKISEKYELEYIIKFISILRVCRNDALNFINKIMPYVETTKEIRRYTGKLVRQGTRLNIYRNYKKVDYIDDADFYTHEQLKKMFNDRVKELICK